MRIRLERVSKRKVVWKPATVITCILAAGLSGSCLQRPNDGADDQVTKLGSIEVTAKLVEIIFHENQTFPSNQLYDYVYIFKYDVVERHRGSVDARTIYVGHYNPLKARTEAADERVEGIGGNLETFKAGDIHRMALEVPIDDYYMGPIVNKYHGKTEEPLYLAVWTNRVTR